MKVRVELIREGPSKKIYIKSPKDAVKQLSEYSKRDREHLLCIYLNTKNRILGIEVVSIGILNSSICHPREVFKGAILASAKSIIFTKTVYHFPIYPLIFTKVFFPSFLS